MYTEEPKKSIDWGSVIKKGIVILIIALIIFLFIWLFTRNNKNDVDVQYKEDNNSNISETITNTDAYSKEFIDGYRYFHDTAKEYFLISELPSNGQTLKYTLQELVDKGLILPFAYKNGEPCDLEASYVTVTNENGKYNMTTTLVCGREVAKTTEELGCNQLCIKGNCDVTIKEPEKEIEYGIEYQYKQAYQATETIYTCPSGYSKMQSGNSTICVKGDANTIKPTKVVSYNCPSGYTKSGEGENAICIIEQDKSISPVCPNGYTKLENGVCSRTVKVNKTVTADPVCPSGYTKSGSGKNITCSKVVTGNKTETTDPVCPSGYAKSGSGSSIKCSKTVTTNKTETADLTCPSGYTKSGSGASTKCSKTVTSSSTVTAKSVFSHYSCSEGTNLGNGKCRVYSTSRYYISTTIYYGKTYNGCTYSGSYVSSCSAYKGCTKTYYQYYCSKSSYTDKNATAIYTCPSGYNPSGNVSANTTCYKTVTSTSTQTTSPVCPDGYTKSGNSCTKSVPTTETQTTNPVCPSGYTASGSGSSLKCSRQVSNNSTVTTDPTCPNGYTKSGSGKNITCSKVVTENKTETTDLICPAGFTKSGSGNNTKCTATDKVSKKAVKHTEYNCPSGYTKIGLGSEATCTKTITAQTNPTVSTRNVTKYKYQWSCDSNLTGWEKTGKTRKSATCSKNEEVIVK